MYLEQVNNAGDVRKGLNKEGLCVKSFVVDDMYITGVSNEGIQVISLSSFRNNMSSEAVLINGVSNVKRFRQIISDGIFEEIYVWYEPNFIWDYDNSFWQSHKSEMDDVNKSFADEESRKTAKAFLNAKKTGIVDSDIEEAFDEATYFNSLTKGRYDGAYVDCGAYNGDSVGQFIRFTENVESTQEVFAFEPDDENFNVMVSKFSNDKMVHCVKKGIWNCQETLCFNAEGNMGAKLADDAHVGNVNVEVTDIDSVVGDTKVGFIKMDIEGSELCGLMGAAKTIKRDHPVLAISAYHKQGDLIELPQYIKSFDDDNIQYKLYLRHHGICAYELVLYAIPE